VPIFADIPVDARRQKTLIIPEYECTINIQRRSHRGTMPQHAAGRA
jgi:hypothetical protein